MRYILLTILITQTLFSMNLTSSQANKAMKYLKGHRGILLYKNNNFNYIPVRSIHKTKGRIPAFGSDKFSVIHDDTDYHININNKPVDLAQVYYKQGNSHKWVRVGSKILPSAFYYRPNDTFYIYKSNEKIPQKIKRKLKKVNKVKVIHAQNNSSMTLSYTDADVYQTLERKKSNLR